MISADAGSGHYMMEAARQRLVVRDRISLDESTRSFRTGPGWMRMAKSFSRILKARG